MQVAVLVPRRADGGHRDQVWTWLQERWAREHPDWPVHEGHHDDGPFNRSAAINQAAAAAGDWDVAVIADGDTFVGREQLERAVKVAHRTGQMTLAYDRFVYLSHAMTQRILGGFVGNWWDGVEFVMHGTCSSMVVVTRELWDTVGGFDEGFVGWGGEDIGFSLAAQTFGGGLQRVPGEAWHGWHPPAAHTHDDEWTLRIERYKPAAYSPPAMRALLDELQAEVATCRSLDTSTAASPSTPAPKSKRGGRTPASSTPAGS